MTTTFDHRPAADRYHTRIEWLDSRHSFSFGPHFEPDNVGHGLLIVSNDDVVAPGGGFGTHSHRDMEIVTWVLDGELEHRDSAGNEGVIRPGEAQRMSAGRGIRHSEMNASATRPVHFVQMWVPPAEAGIEPGYEQRDIGDRLRNGELVAVASGRGHDGAVTIHQPGAVLWAARLEPSAAVDLPHAPYLHVFAAAGAVRVARADGETFELAEGDALRVVDAADLTLTAIESGTDRPTAEILVWESDASAR